MSALNYNDFRYSYIVHIIWDVVSRYSRQIAVIPEVNPTLTDNQLVDWDNMRLIRFSFHKVENCKTLLSDDDIKAELNMSLQYEILPEQDILKPFKAGDGFYESFEALYVHEVKTVGNYMFVDVLFVDSMTAYRMVRESENEQLRNYI